MEDVAAFAPYPPATIRLSLAPEEWTSCLNAWLDLTTLTLRLPESKFQGVISNVKYGVVAFVTSYVQQSTRPQTPSQQPSHNTTLSLHKAVFLLCHRILSLSKVPPALTLWTFLAQFAGTYHSVHSLPKLLALVWTNHSRIVESQIQLLKKSIVNQLDSGDISAWQPTLQQLISLIKACPLFGNSLVLGTDLIDSLANSFSGTDTKLLRTLAIFTYLLLVSLITIPKPSCTVLSEHLYTLKVNAKLYKSQGRISLLTAVVSETPFVHQLEEMETSGSGSTTSEDPEKFPRAKIAASLQEFINPKPARYKQKKPIGHNEPTRAIIEDVHFHRMGKVLQIQEMLPDLGSAFVAKVLREYNDDEETALNHLLNNSLPSHLANADRTEQLSGQDGVTVEDMEARHIMEPRSTPPPTSRRSKFDGDELDNLTVASSRLYIGKARQDLTADDLLGQASPNKAAIYNSLRAFDADDDERDDTYDETDVGGTVDNTVDTDRDAVTNAERLLYQTWKSSPNVFGRDSVTRSTPRRVKLKQDTKWSDEQIEGWAFMLEREPHRKRNLERRFGDDWHGEQREAPKTSWTASNDEDGDSDGQPRDSQNRGSPHRGRGGFYSSRGRGNAAGPSRDADTQRARRGKEVRGSNHRKAGRARKLARSGPTI